MPWAKPQIRLNLQWTHSQILTFSLGIYLVGQHHWVHADTMPTGHKVKSTSIISLISTQFQLPSCSTSWCTCTAPLDVTKEKTNWERRTSGLTSLPLINVWEIHWVQFIGSNISFLSFTKHVLPLNFPGSGMYIIATPMFLALNIRSAPFLCGHDGVEEKCLEMLSNSLTMLQEKEVNRHWENIIFKLGWNPTGAD